MLARITRVVAVAVVALLAGEAWAQCEELAGAEARFRLEWEPGVSRRQQPIVAGYVYNTAPVAVERMQLCVESMDAAGRVVGTTTAWVEGRLHPDDRLYFEVRVPASGASYRITVRSVDWAPRGGGV